MSASPLRKVLNRLHEVVRPPGAAGVSDADLLSRWLADRDEAAFELLLRRHGPMVFGVCRRLLSRREDVEDAFQATFLVLVTKAGSIGKRGSVASWLYKIAYRVALRARARLAKQTAQVCGELPARPQPDGPLWNDVGRVLDEELNRLPERYRAAFVLTQLEGKSNEDAARECGVPLGTVVSRLARARERLRARLTRRGVTLSAGLLAAELSQEAAAAEVPITLIGATMKAVLWGAAERAVAAGCLSVQAAALTKGVLHAMWITKLKLTVATVLSVAVLGSGGTMTYRTLAADDTPGGTSKLQRPGKKLADADEPIRFWDEELKQQIKQAIARQEQLEAELRVGQAQLQDLLKKLDVATADRIRTLARHPVPPPAVKNPPPPNVPNPNNATLPSATPPPPTSAANPRPLYDAFNPLVAAPPVDRAEANALRDAVELSEAQLASKQAWAEAARATLGIADQRNAHVRELLKRGAISNEEASKAEVELVQAKAAVDMAQADMKEAQIRLKQAQRRLNYARGPQQSPPAGSGVEQQLRDLEKKLDALRGEMDQLKQQVQRRQ